MKHRIFTLGTAANLWFATITAIALFTACGSSPKASGPDELDAAIRAASDYLNDNIPGGNKIVILNVQSDSAALSEYIIDELLANAVNDKVFSVVDRQQLDVIRAELDFQWAGEVDDNSAQEIGKMLGAQTIVSGAVGKLGENYRMRIRALEVQTAQVQGQFNRNIPNGPTIADLLNSKGSGYGGGSGGGQRVTQGGASGGGSAGSGGGTTAQAPAQAAATYKIGDTGPAGGLVFYDKGNNTGGWRYLEAAPADTERELSRNTPDGIKAEDRRVGAGKMATKIFMEGYEKTGGAINTAAWYCDQLEVNGFDDWYLPSVDELLYMYNNLYLKHTGDFRAAEYWTSTEPNSWYVDFSKGNETYSYRSDAKRRVRACRQF